MPAALLRGLGAAGAQSCVDAGCLLVAPGLGRAGQTGNGKGLLPGGAGQWAMSYCPAEPGSGVGEIRGLAGGGRRGGLGREVWNRPAWPGGLLPDTVGQWKRAVENGQQDQKTEQP